MILGKESLSTDIVLGADGTDIVFENVEITLRIYRKEEHQFKVKAKERATLEKENLARTMSTAGFQKESLEEKDGSRISVKVVTQITLEVSMRPNRYQFNSSTSQRCHS